MTRWMDETSRTSTSTALTPGWLSSKGGRPAATTRAPWAAGAPAVARPMPPVPPMARPLRMSPEIRPQGLSTQPRASISTRLDSAAPSNDAHPMKREWKVLDVFAGILLIALAGAPACTKPAAAADEMIGTWVRSGKPDKTMLIEKADK